VYDATACRGPQKALEAENPDILNWTDPLISTIVDSWRGENTHPGALNFYPIFIPLLEAKVSGVSVQDMLFCLTFLTPET